MMGDLQRPVITVLAAELTRLRRARTRTTARFRELRMTAGVLWAAIETHREGEQAMRRERDALRAALVDLVAWLRTDAEVFSTMSHLHGARPSDEQVATHRRVWARVEAALASAATPEEVARDAR